MVFSMRRLTNVFGKCIALFFITVSGIALAQAQEDLARQNPERASVATILQKAGKDTRVGNRQHELVPSIASSADGKVLYLAWYTGGPGEGPGNYVTLSVSTDHGNTWKNDELVVYPKTIPYRFYDPALWRDPFGQVWLYYGVSNAQIDNLWDWKAGVNALPIAWNGRKVTYKAPKLISHGVMMNKPTYIPQKNMALFPVSMWDLGEKHPKDANYIEDGAFIHKYQYKRNKSTLGPLSHYGKIPTLAGSLRSFDEHQVVQLTDEGELLCLIRTRKGVYASRSVDFGENWSVPESFTAAGPTTSSRLYIGKLQSGNLILIMNNSITRNNMTAFISKDGGKTWPHRLLLDAREQVSYPDLEQTPDGTIHVTFDRDRFKSKDILYCRFQEADVFSGDTSKVFKTKVNK